MDRFKALYEATERREAILIKQNLELSANLRDAEKIILSMPAETKPGTQAESQALIDKLKSDIETLTENVERLRKVIENRWRKWARI